MRKTRNRNRFQQLSEKRRAAALIGVETKRYYRMIGPEPERIPETTPKLLPFSVTFNFGGDSVTFFPKSLRHLAIQASVLAKYSGPDNKYKL